MARVFLAPTDEFYEQVEAYRKKRGYKKWQQALLELAAMGLLMAGEVEVKPPYKAHGGAGKGKSKRADGLNLERIELELRGLPPLADDE